MDKVEAEFNTARQKSQDAVMELAQHGGRLDPMSVLDLYCNTLAAYILGDKTEPWYEFHTIFYNLITEHAEQGMAQVNRAKLLHPGSLGSPGPNGPNPFENIFKRNDN